MTENWVAGHAAGHTGRFHSPRPKITVPAGLAEGAPGIEQPWAIDQAIVDRRRQAPIRPTRIADSGEATPATCLPQYAEPAPWSDFTGSWANWPQIEACGNEMHMRVDQTRHERLALAVNDLACGTVIERAEISRMRSPSHQTYMSSRTSGDVPSQRGTVLQHNAGSWSSLPSRNRTTPDGKPTLGG